MTDQPTPSPEVITPAVPPDRDKADPVLGQHDPTLTIETDVDGQAVVVVVSAPPAKSS
jgi:hypothetical protein